MLIITRQEAGLRGPIRPIAKAPVLRSEFYLHHSVTALTTDPLSDWRRVQQAGFDRGFADISYTFGVHATGVVLEGRATNVEGAHTEGFNRTGHAVVLIGNYDNLEPTTKQIESVRWLRWHLVNNKILTPAHSFRYHKQVQRTACPGMKAISRFNEFSHPYQPPTGDDMPSDKDVVDACECYVEGCGGWFRLQYDGGVTSSGNHTGDHFLGSAFSDDIGPGTPHWSPTRRFLTILNEEGRGYTLFGTDGSFWERR